MIGVPQTPTFRKNKFSKVAFFSKTQNVVLPHHDSPANHQNFTTKNHPRTLTFSQNPL